MSVIELAESFGINTEGALTGTSNDAFRAQRSRDPRVREAVRAADELWGRVWGGDRVAAAIVNEAMTTSDLFVSATGDVFDRELLAQYQDVPTTWSQYATRSRVRNFKAKKLIDIIGGRTRLDAVPERTEYPGAKYATNEYTIQAKKFGRRFGYSWEAGINDDLDELRTIPNAYARAAALTEEYAVLESLVTSATGVPLTSFFKSYNAAAANPLGYNAFDNSSTAALTSDNLQAGITSVSTRQDKDGNYLPTDRLILMVGPALEFTANRILNAPTVRTTNGTRQTEEGNYLRGRVELVVNPFLVGLSWFLLPAPSSATRPAVAGVFLTGFETPDLRVSNQTGRRAGGGDIPSEEGDFDTDSVYYRVRHVTGGASLDPIHTYGSTGATGTPGV
jgi:hypothetical protein